MARNGSGVYSLPAGSIVTTGDTILAASHNDPLNDIATDMNTARPIVAGGTGADSAAGARTNLGLGTIATQSAASVAITGGSITGITDLAVADGGTGASTAAGALTNLGLTATAAELNILDGVTATAAELNILDGATLTVTELNYVNGVTSAIQTQLNAKAAIASPTFTGTPAAPTATAGTNTTQIATTAFVTTAVSSGGYTDGEARTAQAGHSAGGVGSYALLKFASLTIASAGSNHAGSGLRYTSASADTTGATPAGTWKLLGETTNSNAAQSTAVFLRIS